MKTYSVRITYTHRKTGPGEGRTINVKANDIPVAIARAVRCFWQQTLTKERNDIRRGGLKIDAQQARTEAPVGKEFK